MFFSGFPSISSSGPIRSISVHSLTGTMRGMCETAGGHKIGPMLSLSTQLFELHTFKMSISSLSLSVSTLLPCLVPRGAKMVQKAQKCVFLALFGIRHKHEKPSKKPSTSHLKCVFRSFWAEKKISKKFFLSLFPYQKTCLSLHAWALFIDFSLLFCAISAQICQK